MKWYVMVLDTWSNSSLVGPFESEDAANNYAAGIVKEFDVHVMDQESVDLNMQEFGTLDALSPYPGDSVTFRQI